MSNLTFALPQPGDALAVISQSMDVLPALDMLDESRRRQIVRNVFSPVVLLIEALQLAAAAGPTEKAILMQFIGSIYTQSQLSQRDERFQGLLEKLKACRDSGHSEG
jgi:hypothetical protein